MNPSDAVTGTIIRRNTVQNNLGDGIGVIQPGAAAACPAFGSTIEQNTSSNNGRDGIFVAAGSHDNDISRNGVNGNGRTGIRLNDPNIVNSFTNVGPTLLDLVSPDRPPYIEGTDYRVMPGSGSGDVTAEVIAIDVSLHPSATSTNNPVPVDTSTSGCEQADYDAAGFQFGDVALIQRGTCTFVAKVDLAIANGASAVIMFNEGQINRTTSFFGMVGPVSIPVLSASYPVGFELYNLTRAGTVTIHVATNTTNVPTQAPAPFDNTLIGNRGSGNATFDGYDGNLSPPCDNNTWLGNLFGTVNQPCVGAGEPQAHMTLAKSASPTSGDAPLPVTYTYTLVNDGDPIFHTTVTDDSCGTVALQSGDSDSDQLLDPGETWTLTCSQTLTDTNTNNAVARATSTATGLAVRSNSAQATVTVTPADPQHMSLTKVANPSSGPAPLPVTYTYTLTNTGPDQLFHTTVTDDSCGPVALQSGDANANQLLDPGETWALTCSVTLHVTNTNTAVARATSAQTGLGATSNTAGPPSPSDLAPSPHDQADGPDGHGHPVHDRAGGHRLTSLRY